MNGYIYIIQSEIDQSFYCGSTNSLERRVHQHNTGQVRSTCKKRPWVLNNTYEFTNQSEARRIEQLIKRQKRRIHPNWIHDLIHRVKS